MKDVEQECQFILEERADGLRFCGAAVHRGSYCAEHFQRVYMKHSTYIPAAYRVDDSKVFPL